MDSQNLTWARDIVASIEKVRLFDAVAIDDLYYDIQDLITDADQSDIGDMEWVRSYVANIADKKAAHERRLMAYQEIRKWVNQFRQKRGKGLDRDVGAVLKALIDLAKRMNGCLCEETTLIKEQVSKSSSSLCANDPVLISEENLSRDENAFEEKFDIKDFDRQKKALLEGVTNGNIVGPILLLGPTGSGKTRFADEIWEAYKRRYPKGILLDGSPVPKDYVMLTPSDLSGANAVSEMFGGEKGTFTDVSASCGAFERANGGMLFVDEIGNISKAVLCKLKTALQPNKDGKFPYQHEGEANGKKETRYSKLLFVAATCKDVDEKNSEYAFEEDLLARFRKWMRFPSLTLCPEYILRGISESFKIEAQRRGRGTSLPAQDDKAIELYEDYLCNIELPEGFRTVENFLGLLFEKAPHGGDVITVDIVQKAICDFERDARNKRRPVRKRETHFHPWSKKERCSNENKNGLSSCMRGQAQYPNSEMAGGRYGAVKLQYTDAILNILGISTASQATIKPANRNCIALLALDIANDGNGKQSDIAVHIRGLIDRKTAAGAAIQWVNDQLAKFCDSDGKTLGWKVFKKMVLKKVQAVREAAE